MLFVQSMPMQDVIQAREVLNYAIKIEHATIPPYLTALYSLKVETNTEIQKRITNIVFQEMQHMGLVANILNAIGGTPEIDHPKFIPSYPGGLPFQIGDRQGNKLDIHLQPFSIGLVKDVFMLIEEPDEPINLPVHTEMALLMEQSFKTIGDFYRDLRSRLHADWFVGDPKRQVVDVVSPVHTLQDAQAAIDIIVQQGEGTTMSPLGPDGKAIAHYYRFEEIAKQLTLSPDKSPPGFAFGPPVIPFDASNVWPTVQDPSSALYPSGSQLRAESDRFNQIYSNLLRALQKTFDGAPDQLESAIGLMFDLKLQAQKLMSMPFAKGLTASPTFEWMAA